MEGGPHQHTIPDILTNLIRLISDLQRKNTTMIDRYIHPRPTPTEIAAYEPRLLILKTRIRSLSQLNLQHLPSLIDDAVSLVASYIRPNVSQLAASSVGIQRIFINHYDRGLAKSLPYDTIHAALIHYEELLHDFLISRMESPSRQPAEELVPRPSPKLPSLCHGAIAFMNDRDHGRISSVADNDLLPPHHGRLADHGGVVLWWECSVCAFRLRYHAKSSVRLNINQTDEIMTEDNVPDIAYRSAWLVKCHIYHPHRPEPPAPSPSTSPAFDFSDWELPPTSPIPPASPEPKQCPQSTQKRVSFSRRKSSSTKKTTDVPDSHKHKHKRTTYFTPTARTRTISPNPPPPPPPARTLPTRPKPTANTSAKAAPASLSRSEPKPKPKPILKPKPKPSPDPTGPHGLRYFCPFCVAQGKPLAGPPPQSSPPPHPSDREPTCFEDSAGFMEHIDDTHTRDRPASLMLLGLKVAVNGEMAPGPERGLGRWDLDLRS